MNRQEKREKLCREYESGKFGLNLEKEFPPVGYRSVYFQFEHFRFVDNLERIPSGLVRHLHLYSVGTTFFTDDIPRCWDILILQSPSQEGEWYVDIVHSSDAIPAPYWKEINLVLEFLEQNKKFLS